MGNLTALRVKAIKNPGRYGDGRGLFLEVGTSGSRSWILRIQVNGKRRDFGLGSAVSVTLAEAREAAEELRRAVKAGHDPVAAKRAAKVEPEPLPTFREATIRVHEENLPSWRNPKHGAQWLTSLETHAFPSFGDVPVSDVTSAMVRDMLAGIWLTVPETARRVRQRVGRVLDWAHAKGYRETEAPMRAVSKGLPKQPPKDKHHPAVPWEKVPDFMAKLREQERAGEPTRAAFEFKILTAARSGEVRLARWREIDMAAREWNVPAERMKAQKAHTVPLSAPAVAILERMAELRATGRPDELVFPGAKQGSPISDMTLSALMHRMGYPETPHGFRSSFRDWAADATNFPREVAEAALAHVLESKVEAAYRRSDLLAKRRKLMEAWAGYCCGGNGKVVPMARPKAAS